MEVSLRFNRPASLSEIGTPCRPERRISREVLQGLSSREGQLGGRARPECASARAACRLIFTVYWIK